MKVQCHNSLPVPSFSWAVLRIIFLDKSWWQYKECQPWPVPSNSCTRATTHTWCKAIVKDWTLSLLGTFSFEVSMHGFWNPLCRSGILAFDQLQWEWSHFSSTKVATTFLPNSLIMSKMDFTSLTMLSSPERIIWSGWLETHDVSKPMSEIVSCIIELFAPS